MFKKIILFVLPLLLIFSLFQYGVNVKADDDDHDEKYEHSWKEKKDDDDDDDDDYGDYEENDDENYADFSNQVQPSYWNIWTREPIVSLNGDLPFQNAKEVNVELNNKNHLFFIVPENNQLLVSGEKLADFLGAKTKFYSQSKILVMTKGEEELIVRAGTNAAFENRIKTPMPSKALYYEKSIYVPVSVIANSFGYRVTWDSKAESISLQQIN